jgi:hypothetical protein
VLPNSGLIPSKMMFLSENGYAILCVLTLMRPWKVSVDYSSKVIVSPNLMFLNSPLSIRNVGCTELEFGLLTCTTIIPWLLILSDFEKSTSLTLVCSIWTEEALMENSEVNGIDKPVESFSVVATALTVSLFVRKESISISWPSLKSVLLKTREV